MTTIKINGQDVDVPTGAVAWKYNDPIEDARWLYDESEAREIASVDPSLVAWAPGFNLGGI